MDIAKIKEINRITKKLEKKINEQLKLQKDLIRIKKEVEALQNKLNELTKQEQ
jgi:predicted nuclease with TOPRIM domain